MTSADRTSAPCPDSGSFVGFWREAAWRRTFAHLTDVWDGIIYHGIISWRQGAERRITTIPLRSCGASVRMTRRIDRSAIDRRRRAALRFERNHGVLRGSAMVAVTAFRCSPSP